MKYWNFLPISFFIISFFFFLSFFFKNLLPIPSDTIVGLYHPFRDSYAKDYPRGVPFKNFLITDPVRQQYPWRNLAISLEKNFKIPTWNPYTFAGSPLLANIQSAVFYPLNIVFFIVPFPVGWSILIFLEPVLAGLFFYLYLSNLKIHKIAAFLGAFAFSYSGFSTAWLEWGTVVYTAMWLPIVLLSIDKVLFHKNAKKSFLWNLLLILSLVFSLLGGHLQMFFYVCIFSALYILVNCNNKKLFLTFLCDFVLFLCVSAIQWFPTLQFILLSTRNMDQGMWQMPGWFIPWQQIIQFLVPDFFGNPTTLNYWGVWNYGELIGYIGIIPFSLSLYAMLFKRDKVTLFYTGMLCISLLFSLPTVFARIPYILNVPFLSSSQPTRLIFIIDFCLAVLSSLGFEYILKKKKISLIPYFFLIFLFVSLWSYVTFLYKYILPIDKVNVLVASRNLIVPTIFVILGFIVFVFYKMSKSKSVFILTCFFIISLSTIDLYRFFTKFTPFTSKEYLFPQTYTLLFLQQKIGSYRYMTNDNRIFPPNFSIIYKLQTIDGYDPLYLLRYAELIASSERSEPNIQPPFGYNRIIAPHNYESFIADLLGVKYVLSLSEQNSPKLKKVYQEGQTRVYENLQVFPRAFFVKNILFAQNKNESINLIFKEKDRLRENAIVENNKVDFGKLEIGKVEIKDYEETQVVLETKNSEQGFLVLTDSFYPTWSAFVDSKETLIYRTDYNFRGILIPKGKHTIVYKNNIF